jgi:RNA polymerase sigma-70 factor (sigma-E family)
MGVAGHGLDVFEEKPVRGQAMPLTRRLDGTGRDAPVTRLFDRDYVALCRLATVLLADPARAEDVVQEAFLRTFSGWGRLRDPSKADAYLRRAVVNLSRSGLRRRRRELRGNEATWWRDDRRDSAGLSGGIDDSVRAVLDAVRGLPPRQREAVVLHYLADLTEADVAAAMGCSVGTVKSQLSKARTTLALQLKETFDD